MALLRNAIVALEKQKIPIFKETIVKTVEAMLRTGEPKELLKPGVREKLTQEAKALVAKEIAHNRSQQTALSFGGANLDFVMK